MHMSQDSHNSSHDPVREAVASIDLDDEQIVQWIRCSRPHSAGVWLRRRLAMLAMMVAAVVISLTGHQDDLPWRRLLPVGMVTAVMAAIWWFSNSIRRVRVRYGQTMVHMQLRQWPTALQMLDRLLSRPVDSSDMRAAALLSASELATRSGKHDAAVTALDEVLAGPVSVQYAQRALAEKALALLRAERLTEATSLLDGFRSIEFVEPSASVVAVGQLYQRIRTRNFTAIAEEADALAERARAVFHRQAAYVYALIALALSHVDQTDRAQAYYDCATHLISPAELARRYAELDSLADRLQPARSPL